MALSQVLLLPPSGAFAHTVVAKAGRSMMRTVCPEHHCGGGSRVPAAYLRQLASGQITLAGAPQDGGESVWHAGPLPWENARTCPVSLPGGESGVPSVHESVRVGVAVVLADALGSVLLTRRARHMRSFPRAWVCPGGALDPGETLVEAAIRELREETGVEVEASLLQPLCLWESVFPTTPEACAREGRIKGHFLLIFFAARLPSGSARPRMRLQPEETDVALWLPEEHLQAFSLTGEREEEVSDVQLELHEEVEEGDLHSTRDARGVPLRDLAQCYPSADGQLKGCGEAHLFALRELAAQAQNCVRPNMGEEEVGISNL